MAGIMGPYYASGRPTKRSKIVHYKKECPSYTEYLSDAQAKPKVFYTEDDYKKDGYRLCANCNKRMRDGG